MNTALNLAVLLLRTLEDIPDAPKLLGRVDVRMSPGEPGGHVEVTFHSTGTFRNVPDGLVDRAVAAVTAQLELVVGPLDERVERLNSTYDTRWWTQGGRTKDLTVELTVFLPVSPADRPDATVTSCPETLPPEPGEPAAGGAS